ncbi:MAG: hypothetical protein WBE76_06905 [Terracidiphilus sp.]
MKRWPWRKILAMMGVGLVIVGIIPLAECLRLEYAPRPEPFLMQFPLKKGVYTSAPFRTGFHGPARIDLEWRRSIPRDQQQNLDLDWKIVDDRGRIVTKGSYNSRWIVGTTACLGGWAQGYRKGQRIVLTLPGDAQGVDESAWLKIGVDADEIGLDMSYAGAIVWGWAVIVAGPGALLLILLLAWRVRSNRTSPSTP